MPFRFWFCVLGTLLCGLVAHFCLQRVDAAGAGVVFAFMTGVYAGFGVITWQDYGKE